MFYSVQALLLTKTLSFSSHKGVISSFGKEFVKTGIFPKEMSRDLTQIFERRQLSDYGVFLIPAQNEVTETLKVAEVFINIIVEYLKTKSFLE